MKKVIALMMCVILCVSLVPFVHTAAAGTITVHAQIPSSWGAAYLYAWDNSNNYVGDPWPGSAMTRDGKWYTLKISSDAANLIVSNNGSPQTQDMAIKSGKKEVWIVVGSDNQGTVYYSKPSGTSSSQSDVGKKYQVVGSGSIFGKDWEISEDHVMTKKSNGTFAKTYTNVAKGTLGLKILMNGNVWIPDGMGNETFVDVPADGSTVTVTFNPKTGKMSVDVMAPPAPDPTEPPTEPPTQPPTDPPASEPSQPNPTDPPVSDPAQTDPGTDDVTDPEPGQTPQQPGQNDGAANQTALWIGIGAVILIAAVGILAILKKKK